MSINSSGRTANQWIVILDDEQGLVEADNINEALEVAVKTYGEVVIHGIYRKGCLPVE